jgi:hypothetical protein
MKKKAGTADLDDMPAEYNLDHSRARPNRFASRLPQGHVIGIVLEEDVAEVFDSSEAVNRFLRSAIEAMPRRAPKPNESHPAKKTKRQAS